MGLVPQSTGLEPRLSIDQRAIQAYFIAKELGETRQLASGITRYELYCETFIIIVGTERRAPQAAERVQDAVARPVGDEEAILYYSKDEDIYHQNADHPAWPAFKRLLDEAQAAATKEPYRAPTSEQLSLFASRPS